ncbi:delta-class carbonic anhydrase [Marinobacterium jannaschii]|uniref:delta-class carbonic anhydrase n=1 Tax=Marinobacterium jannaschii TaxID=64970 RepID=UPI00048131E6|nr:delta-class carbonic anhydrase [Marinobacterium jannaschii]
MKTDLRILLVAAALSPLCAHAGTTATGGHDEVSDQVIKQQRERLRENTQDKGFGPQSPRDIDSLKGNNKRLFGAAPAFPEMNLCNIHFHKNAEHKGGEFTRYAGNGDGHGFRSGYRYSGQLSATELAPLNKAVCAGSHGGLYPGDTIEVHYVHSSARIKPGPTLKSCLSPSISNPQLRVEAQVYVLVNDRNAADFAALADHGVRNGRYQALGIPDNTGKAVQYAGSTTGPGYNEKGSPFQVAWSVRPRVMKVDIETVGQWCKGNDFNEDHGHGVRNLVINPDLLSRIAQQ